jgi:peptide/nickel transport system permease protein
MLKLIAARLAQLAFVIILVTALAFALLNLLKGNIVDAILGENYTPQAAADLSHQLHLD